MAGPEVGAVANNGEVSLVNPSEELMRAFDEDFRKQLTGGNGIGNLKQRMQEAGGGCGIETFRKQGTTIFLTLPLLATSKPVS